MATEFTEADAREVKSAVEGTEKSFEKPASAIKPGNQPGTFPANFFAKRDDEKRLRMLQDYTRYAVTYSIVKLTGGKVPRQRQW